MYETDAMEAASRCLRLALPLMSKQGCPVTPLNYAVWYEYVSGTNRGLAEALDALIESGAKADEAAMRDLHDRFLGVPDEATLVETRDSILRVIGDVVGIVVDAGSSQSRYQDDLGAYRARLNPEIRLDELRTVVDGLSEDTQAARDAGSDLRRRLEESRREAASLRDELDKAREEASSDLLTGLANRKGLEQAYANALEDAEHDGPGLCLVLGDIDHFKKVNDTHGHVVGDKVIRHVGNVMRSLVKGRDTVARWGGEEYAVLLPETPFTGALALADNIRKQVARSRLVKTNTGESIGRVTLSIGVTMQQPGEELEALISRADTALYRAKSNGRNRVEAEAAAGAATGTDG